MELRHIRYFLAVADTLSFSRAAEQLHVAQSALSRQIKDLEDELGGKLFHRTTAKVCLTEMGSFFQQQMRRSVMQFDITVTGARQLVRGITGSVRIGCDWRLPSLPIAAAAGRFREEHPRVGIEFIELPCHKHISQVLNHTLDIGIIPSLYLGEAENLELRKIYQLKLKVILSARHPLASKNRITLDELKNECWLVFDENNLPGAKVFLSQILRFSPRYATAAVSTASLVSHVAAGYGIGIYADLEAQRLDDSVVAFDTDFTPIDLFTVSLKDPATPIVASYLDIFEHMMEKRRNTESQTRFQKMCIGAASHALPLHKQRTHR